MRDVTQYFDLVAKIIELSPAVEEELDLEQFDHKRGMIEGAIHFADGSRLEFTERIIIENARPVKRDYRYQYVCDQRAVFRYDNAPHHPRLPNFPHHKHIGRRTVSAIEPLLKDVLCEIAELLNEASDQSSTLPRRSRQKTGRKAKQ